MMAKNAEANDEADGRKAIIDMADDILENERYQNEFGDE
jgi:hypothetical protein